MKLDILAFAAHPDDVEISCAGTVIKHITLGKKVGIVDLTQGELGTRGSGPLRLEEAKKSAEILGLSVRDNLGFADGFFQNDKKHQLPIIEQIRTYRPEIVLCNSVSDRHPDHGRASKLVSEACFLSGLRKVDTGQDAWRPKAVYHYIQDYLHNPDFVVDVSDFMDQKIDAIKAFASQFYDPTSDEPETPIAKENFFDFLYARARQFGRPIGAEFGEGFTVERYLGVDDLFSLK